MILRKKSFLLSLVIACMVTAIFVPELPALRPFHVSLLPLGMAALLLKYTRPQMLAIVGLVFLSFLGSTLSFLIYGLPLGVGFIWAAFPIIVLMLSVFVTANLKPSGIVLYRLLILCSVILSVFVLLQVFFPGSSFLSLFVSEARSEVWTRYAMVIAPTGNPNSIALLLSLIILALETLAFGAIDPRVRQWIRRDHGLLSSRLLLIVLLGTLSIGIFYAYARTVLVAFILAECVFALFLLRGKRRGQALVLMFALAFLGFLIFVNRGTDRQIHHYAEILAPANSASLTVRYEQFWKNALALFGERPMLYITGVGWYEGALQELQETLVIDSSYVYLLVSHGVLVSIAFILIVLYGSVRYRTLVPLMLVLFLAGITLPFLSDYRLNIIIGSLVGWFIALERQSSHLRHVPLSFVSKDQAHDSVVSSAEAASSSYTPGTKSSWRGGH